MFIEWLDKMLQGRVYQLGRDTIGSEWLMTSEFNQLTNPSYDIIEAFLEFQSKLAIVKEHYTYLPRPSNNPEEWGTYLWQMNILMNSLMEASYAINHLENQIKRKKEQDKEKEE